MKDEKMEVTNFQKGWMHYEQACYKDPVSPWVRPLVSDTSTTNVKSQISKSEHESDAAYRRVSRGCA